jgi:DNA-binding NtrC family response regulator
MKPQVLRAEPPDSSRRVVPLSLPRLRLGRGDGNEVVLPGASVHPVHALLLLRDRGYEVVDLSGEGVRLNGRRVARAAVQPGDVVAIADHEIEIGETGSGAASAEPEATRAAARVEPPASPAILRVLTRSRWRNVRLPRRPTFVGSSSDNDVVLDDPSVSRWHCRLLPGRAGFEVEDLVSTNGTFVNGVRVARSAIPVGSELRLGRTVAHLLAAEAVAAEEPPTFAGLVGQSPPMLALYQRISRLAAERDPVLLFGETGTGKELVARALHACGPRRDRPFVALNCGALPRELVESEMFGHERGAFSGAIRERRGLFEEADGGTLFLDEVAELSPEIQSKLLRFLESGEVRRVGSNRPRCVDVRVVAACNRSLWEMVQAGRFRLDLFHRLSVIELRLPPLRERLEDLPSLVQHFLGGAGGSGKVVDAAAMARLLEHTWPGNVRELRNVLRRASLRAEGAVIGREHLELDREAPFAGQAPCASLADIERRAIQIALNRNRGNKAAACRELGIARSTFFEKLRRYGLGAMGRG